MKLLHLSLELESRPELSLILVLSQGGTEHLRCSLGCEEGSTNSSLVREKGMEKAEILLRCLISDQDEPLIMELRDTLAGESLRLAYAGELKETRYFTLSRLQEESVSSEEDPGETSLLLFGLSEQEREQIADFLTLREIALVALHGWKLRQLDQQS